MHTLLRKSPRLLDSAASVLTGVKACPSSAIAACSNSRDVPRRLHSRRSTSRHDHPSRTDRSLAEHGTLLAMAMADAAATAERVNHLKGLILPDGSHHRSWIFLLFAFQPLQSSSELNSSKVLSVRYLSYRCRLDLLPGPLDRQCCTHRLSGNSLPGW